MQMGAMIVIIATKISIALKICDAISITEIAPMYNSELIMLDTMPLASIRFLFIVLRFKKERKKERKKRTKRKKEFILCFFCIERCYSSTS